MRDRLVNTRATHPMYLVLIYRFLHCGFLELTCRVQLQVKGSQPPSFEFFFLILRISPRSSQGFTWSNSSPGLPTNITTFSFSFRGQAVSVEVQHKHSECRVFSRSDFELSPASEALCSDCQLFCICKRSLLDDNIMETYMPISRAILIFSRCWLHDGEWLYKAPILTILLVS